MSERSVPAARSARRHRQRLMALAVLVGAAAALWIPFPRETPPPEVSEPVLVVLPFHASGVNAPTQTLLGDEFSRDLIAQLAHVDGLRVIGPASAARAQAETFGLDQLHTRLHANRVLQGGVREAGEQLLVELRLSTLPEGRTLWAQAYTQPRAQLPALERRVGATVAESLGLKAAAAPPPAAAPPRWFEFLAARHELAAGERPAAIEHLHALLAAAPDYAPAQAALARALTASLRRDDSDPARPVEAERLARSASASDPDLADAQLALAVLACRATEWDDCLRGFARTLALAPEDTDARTLHAYWLGGIGYVDQALLESERAWNADPLSYDANFARARMLDTAGRHDEARGFLDASDPSAIGLVYARWHNAMWRGDLAAARTHAGEMPQSDGFRESYLGITEAMADPGRWAQIQPMISTSERATGRANVLRIMLPQADYGVAIEGLERMLRNGWPSYYLLLWMPEYRALRADPAFGALLARTHIADYWRAHGFPARCREQDGIVRCD